VRSLITLKALTYAPSGGLVASATTSLPERLGGVRNWDYRYCWLRDATFALYALMTGGYVDEARAWRGWLLRAIAGKPEQAQILYGVAGERLLPEWSLAWLPGYEASAPVRVGNAATTQFQLDVFGEIADALHVARRVGLDADQDAWRVERVLVEFVESAWQKPDEGIWEVRGPRRPFTHSKVMAWVALDRAVKAVQRFGLEGPVERWRAVRDAIHADVCRHAFDREIAGFVQYYGAKLLDASLLMIPLVGFLPATDPRMIGTVEAIEKRLMSDGLVARYQTAPELDGLPPGEGTFLVLARRQSRAAGAARRGESAVRAAPRRSQRSWTSIRAVRPGCAAPRGQFPSSVHARRPHQYGEQPHAPRRTGQAPERGLTIRRSWVQISKQRRWSCMALPPGLRARPSIASCPVPMVMSQPSHASPAAERPRTRAAFSRGRRPFWSLRRIIRRIVSKSMRGFMAVDGRDRHQVFPSAREWSFLGGPRAAQPVASAASASGRANAATRA